MSDTPKTDELAKREFITDGVWIRHARQLERENAALRKDKARLDWILTDDGGHWVNWMYEKEEWTPELKASRDAIDACLKPSTWKEAQP